MRVASIGEGLLEIWDAELPRAQYPLFHALRERAAWIRGRLAAARIPVSDLATPSWP